LRCADPLPRKMERVLAPDGPYRVPGLGPAFWSAVFQGLDPLRHPAWLSVIEAGVLRLGLTRRRSTDGPGRVYASLLDAYGMLRSLEPALTALHVDHFLSLAATTLVSEALDAVRTSDVASEALVTIYVSDAEGRLTGTALVVRLLKAAPSAALGDVAEPDPVTVRADADLHAIVRKMSDFNLSTTPVVDAEHRMIGVITVDDVLELLLPTGWRKDFGMTTADE